MKTGIYCPATKANCDRPCVGAECQRVKLWGIVAPGGVLDPVPRPPPPDCPPVISPAQCRAARAYLHLSLAQFGRLARCCSKTLSAFETGKKRPLESTLRKIIGAFYDEGIEIIGTAATVRGIRDFKPMIAMGKVNEK